MTENKWNTGFLLTLVAEKERTLRPLTRVFLGILEALLNAASKGSSVRLGWIILLILTGYSGSDLGSHPGWRRLGDVHSEESSVSDTRRLLSTRAAVLVRVVVVSWQVDEHHRAVTPVKSLLKVSPVCVVRRYLKLLTVREDNPVLHHRRHRSTDRSKAPFR